MKSILLVFFLYYLGLYKAAGQCSISLKTDLPTKNDPVYLEVDPNNNLVLALPDNGSVILNNQQVFILACTGDKNSLIESSDAVTTTKCLSGSNLDVKGKEYPSSSLNCSSRATASLLITQNRCYGNAVIIQSGFQVGDKWFPLIDTCHNIDQANSLWSRHTLYGSRLAGKVIQNNRPGFSRGNKDLYSGFDPNVAYQQSNQKDVFTRIYGPNSADKYIVPSKNMYLSRGHLSPDADFLFASWQMLTYFYVNTAPEWQTINAGNWLAVETNARKVAMNLKQDILDITGTYGVLSLADDSGVMKEAYLQDNRLPVPNLIWKVLQNPSDNSCIVLISTNNPYLQSPPEPICPDICSKTGWPVLQKDLTKGYVYCCDYQTFFAQAPQVPPLSCVSVLKFQ